MEYEYDPWKCIRNSRNLFLQESDWIALIDCQLSEAKKNEWINYRQALRDITQQSDPNNLIWPERPQ